jgi:hemolysin activation/secretion protein
MPRTAFLIATLLASTAAQAQVARDAAATLGRDVAAPVNDREAKRVNAKAKVTTEAADSVSARAATDVFVGAINVEGGREIPRTALAPVIERFIGQAADANGLQAIARAISDAARAQGYVFASAMIPAQDVATGTITVRLDPGAVNTVRITGSHSERLQRTLDLIRGPAVQRAVLERQLLLAGDIPGIIVETTRYVREPQGAVLIVEVRDDRVGGSVGLDNYGSREIGPARARLRVDLTGLMDGDNLTVQAVATPLKPKELAYVSARYVKTLDIHGTQLGIAASAGQTRPEYGNGADVRGDSRYAAVFASHPLVRTNKTSLWVNGELAFLNVRQRVNGALRQRDEVVTFTLGTTMTAKIGGGRLWGGFGVVQGMGFADTTREGDAMSSRADASGRFSKASLWLDWKRSISEQVSLRLAANGQVASRPLLAAQELGIGGPGFGRAYDFSERFGDNGVLGMAELREQWGKLLAFDWVQLYQFVDGGYVTNLRGGFGNGTRVSAGGGVRAGIGKTSLGVEAAFPISDDREATGNRHPRINLTVGQDF